MKHSSFTFSPWYFFMNERKQIMEAEKLILQDTNYRTWDSTESEEMKLNIIRCENKLKLLITKILKQQ